MAPSWVPKSSPNREKIDAKIDQKIDPFQDRFLKRFCWILGRKMEASWHQYRSNIDACCETRFFEKSCSPCSGGSIFQDSGVQVGNQNRSKREVNMGRHLGIDFWWIWSIWGGKLGGKMEPKSILKGIEKTMEKWKPPRWPRSRKKGKHVR